MTRPHVHHWALGDPEARGVEGRCACGQVKTFPAFMPGDAHLRHRDHKPSRAQQDESIALMSHAQSLVTS